MNENDLDQLRPDIRHNRVYSDDIVKGRWLEVKGGVRKIWGEITDNELEETKGELTSIAGLIQRKYGEAQDSINEKLDGIFHRIHDDDASIEVDKASHRDKREENPIDAANRNARERQF